MLRSIGLALAVAGLGAPALPAAAAEPSNAKGSAAALACAKRYNTAMRMEETMRGMMKSLMPIMMQQYSVPGEAARERERLVLEAILESSDEMTPRMMDALAPVMAAAFTEAEICGLASFYESPLGQGVVDKMPAYVQASGGVMSEFMPRFQADMLQRLCRKIDCAGPGADPASTRSKAS